MDVRGPTSGHLQVKYCGRCSSSTRWFPSAGVIQFFFDISERLGGESEGEGLRFHVKKLRE